MVSASKYHPLYLLLSLNKNSALLPVLWKWCICSRLFAVVFISSLGWLVPWCHQSMKPILNKKLIGTFSISCTCWVVFCTTYVWTSFEYVMLSSPTSFFLAVCNISNATFLAKLSFLWENHIWHHSIVICESVSSFTRYLFLNYVGDAGTLLSSNTQIAIELQQILFAGTSLEFDKKEHIPCIRSS
jgi:hypothetical protein